MCTTSHDFSRREATTHEWPGDHRAGAGRVRLRRASGGARRTRHLRRRKTRHRTRREGTNPRATITSFGPTLLSKVLGLNEVPESSLGLVFHFADQNGLPLLDPKDLRAVIQYLISDEGGTALQSLGGLSKQTAGVLLRELVTGYDWRSCSPRSAPARRSSPCCRTGAHRPRWRFRWGGCPAGGASS